VRTPGLFIKGIGVYLPETVDIQVAIDEGGCAASEVAAHGFTGAAVAGDVPPPEMALWAAQEAFKRCGHRPDDVDLLLYTDSWYQCPDGWQPQYHLQRHLVGGDVLAVETQHGCNGMFSGIELAAAYLAADEDRRAALLVAADNYATPLMNRWRAGPGFVAGDAASAVVLTKEPGFAQVLSACTLTVPEGEEMHRAGEPMFPPGITTGTPLDFNARTETFVREQLGGPTLWIRIHQQLVENVNRALYEAGIDLDAVKRVAFMNNDRETIEQRCMGALGLPLSRSTWEFGRTVGHLGASDQIVSLDRLLTTGEVGPGDHVLLAGMAAGITLSSAVVRIREVPPWLN
jgi:3-oxoacyl-[acyl-carrier-protein] synthase-3/clorobiocin biosynthesis protein CloN2